MPANDHLQWLDIDDFTPGVWDESAAYNKFAAPPNSFRHLDDYQPMRGGGLRPFFAPTAISMSGIGGDEVPIGIFARNGVVRSAANGGTGTDSADMVLVTIDSVDFKARIYRRDGTVAAPAWSVRFTSTAAASAGHQACAFEYFKDSSDVEWYIISLTAGNQQGTYAMRLDFATTSNTGNDGLIGAAISTSKGPVVVSQARVMVGGGGKIFYSSVGLTTGIDSNNLAVARNRIEADISILTGIEPSDLLIGKEGSPWVQISGDISNASTPVREMGDQHHPRQNKQQVPRTPGGIAFIEPGGRVFETDGRNFKPLSNQLGGRALSWDNGGVMAGGMAFLDGFLFVPGTNSATKGLVYDYESGGWFRTTSLNHVFSWADPYGGYVWTCNHNGAAPLVYGYQVIGGSRVTTGVIQTVPYADKNGRNVDIREVQFLVLTNAASEFKVELLDKDDASVVTRYATVATATKEMVKVQFPRTKSEYLSVKITPRSINGSSEAPTFERLRIGFGQNNLVT